MHGGRVLTESPTVWGRFGLLSGCLTGQVGRRGLGGEDYLGKYGPRVSTVILFDLLGARGKQARGARWVLRSRVQAE